MLLYCRYVFEKILIILEETMKKTKIICTMGPNTNDRNLIKDLALAGMDIARFNFSHGDHEEQAGRFALIKSVREELNIPIATLLDTKGPEIRTGAVKDDKKVTLVEGQKYTLTTRQVPADDKINMVTYAGLPEDVTTGNIILIDDGLIELKVDKVEGTEIECTVINGGDLGSKKGVNVPNVSIRLPGITEKDKEDIIFGVEQGFDFIAASFVRNAACIEEIKHLLWEHGSDIPVIAKIENAEGIANIDDIIRVADGIMVARGDMGVEIPAEEVPHVQKEIIKKCNAKYKPVITATQMLDSMIKNPRPTRAEATDVANAIYDGTSAIMLSGETAAGLYPVEALKTMVKIAIRTEQDIDYKGRFEAGKYQVKGNITNAISHATCTTALDLNAAAIITVTKLGGTARMVSKYRPSCPIIGGSPNEYVCRQLNLSWGVIPVKLENQEKTDDLFDHAVDSAMKKGLLKQGDLTVITAGLPLGVPGTTNLIKVHIAGHILLKGHGVNKMSATANLCVCKNAAELKTYFKTGDIIVVRETDNSMMEQLKEAGGIITEDGDQNSHAAIVGLTLDIPVIIGAEQATSILKNGSYVSMDSDKGVVCSTS